MAKHVVLLTSGFMLPECQWFSPIVKDASMREYLIGKDNPIQADQEMSLLVTDFKVMSPRVYSEAFLAYKANQSFDTFMSLVDGLIQVFEDYTFEEFIRVQVHNNYLSSVGFNLVMDILTDKFEKTYSQYAVAPSFFRMDSGVTPEESNKRKEMYRQVSRSNYRTNLTMVTFLTELASKPHLLSAFFKYVLTDSNRANHYA